MSVVTKQLASYPYQQYADDDDIKAFFTAYNALSQTNLDTANNLYLPIYSNKTGNLLNLVGEGIYGEVRKALGTGFSYTVGMYNTYEYNLNPNNLYELNFVGTSYEVNDSTYKKIIQWNTFKGDGYQFTIRWLKRRIQRFFSNQINPPTTYSYSVTLSGTNVTITIPNSLDATIFQAAIQSQILLVPFQYNFSVTIV